MVYLFKKFHITHVKSSYKLKDTINLNQYYKKRIFVIFKVRVFEVVREVGNAMNR